MDRPARVSPPSRPLVVPDYGLTETNPVQFRSDFDAMVQSAGEHQQAVGDLARVQDELHAALDLAEGQVQEAQQQASIEREAREASEAQHGIAVAAYRQAMLNGDPSIPPDLVQGQTVEDVDTALAKARSIVDYIRDKVKAPGAEGPPGQTAAAPTPPPRVPAGAPGRTLPDVSGMTAREKLIYGTQRAS